MTKTAIAAALFAATVSAAALAEDKTAAQYPTAETLMATSQTIIGETIAYPTTGPAKVTAIVVTIQPGAETGFHKHGVPLFAYVLSGEATVDYGEHGRRTYKTGESFMEAMDAWHNGINVGDAPVRILAVYLGANGSANVIHKK